MSAEKKLAQRGVFAGHHGLRGLAQSNQFWQRQMYGARFYYGHGGGEYLHRSVLEAAVSALDEVEELEARCAALVEALDYALQFVQGEDVNTDFINDAIALVKPK